MSNDQTVESRPSTTLAPTPGQTVGPFYGYSLPYEGDGDLIGQAVPGSVRLHGTVRDGNGDPIPDALLEIWQADPHGEVSREPGSLKRDGYTFTGWGREATDDAGHYQFTTFNPGATDPGSAPFIAVLVFARGLMHKLHTRVYLPEDEQGLASDPLLSSLPEDRRHTLIATRQPNGDLQWDIRLQGGDEQGGDETVFLSFPGA